MAIEVVSPVGENDYDYDLAVIGGGPIGVEFTQIFAAFGSNVRIYEAFDRIMIGEDEENVCSCHDRSLPVACRLVPFLMCSLPTTGRTG